MKLRSGARLCDELQRMHDAVQHATEPRCIVRTEDLRLLFRLVDHMDETSASHWAEREDFRKRLNKKNAELRALRGRPR